MEHLKKLNKKQKIISVVVFGLIVYSLYLVIFNNINSNKEKTYILKEYNTNKRLIGTNEYIIRNGDTILNGKFINYNEKGNKIAEGTFVNGNIFGSSIYYYDNGKVEEMHFRKNKDITLESIWNYPNGKIERYVLYNDFGDTFFIMKYDKYGVVDSYKGIPQIEIYQYRFSHKEEFNIKEDQYLKVGDKLKYSYIVANIPNAKRTFKIENISVDNSKVKRTQKNILPAQIDVEEVLTKKGKNTIKSIVRYEFNDKVTPVFTDTLSFDVNVH